SDRASISTPWAPSREAVMSACRSGWRRLRVWMPILTIMWGGYRIRDAGGRDWKRRKLAAPYGLGAPFPQNAVDLCVRTLKPQSEIRNPISRFGTLRAKPQAAMALAAALILSTRALAEEARHPDAVPVFHCTFGEDWDMNYDGWPDRWVRKSGLGYPHYVNIAIQDDATAVGKKCLQIDLDGAAAAVVSPPIRVMSRFSYVFEAQLKNVGLKYSTVVITLDFCDASGRV